VVFLSSTTNYTKITSFYTLSNLLLTKRPCNSTPCCRASDRVLTNNQTWVHFLGICLPLHTLQFPTADFCGCRVLLQGYCAHYWLTVSRCANRQYTKDRFSYVQIYIVL